MFLLFLFSMICLNLSYLEIFSIVILWSLWFKDFLFRSFFVLQSVHKNQWFLSPWWWVVCQYPCWIIFISSLESSLILLMVYFKAVISPFSDSFMEFSSIFNGLLKSSFTGRFWPPSWNLCLRSSLISVSVLNLCRT